MRIQHNIMAMNAYRNYNTNTSALSKNLEKLSSGYKINRAGDDAAGLAISEKMRAQITGLNAAQKNVKDGISLVKTAEGAMQEIQDMLNRMDYLATQSANGTYDDDVDRANLQKEVTALKSEINRIAESANFNGIKLLDGTQAGSGSSDTFENVSVTGEVDAIVPDRKTQKGEYSIDFKNFEFETKSTAAANKTLNIKVAGKTVATATLTKTGGTITGADIKAVTGGKVTIGDVKFDVAVDGTKLTLKMSEDPKKDFTTKMNVTLDGDLKTLEKTKAQTDVTTALGNNGITDTVTVDKEAIFAPSRVYASAKFTLSGLKDGDQIKIGNEVYTFAIGKDSKYKSGGIDLTHLTETSTDLAKEAAQKLTQAAKDNKMFKVTTTNNDGEVHLTEREGAIDYKATTIKNDLRGVDKTKVDGKWDGLVQKGNAATSGVSTSGLTLQIGDTADTYNQLSVSIGSMKTSAIGIDTVDISTQSGAQSAIDTIKKAINTVSSVRGDLGAVQNRLEHTANNLSVMAENIQDAESTIRDTDVAEEMMAYTKNNILIQSAQAMLAQANAVPQGVLQLLG